MGSQHRISLSANILDFRLERKYDILFSSGVLHYIKPEIKKDIFANYKDFTENGGINALHCFVDKPFIERSPDKETHSQHWKSGELLTLYHDWYIEDCSEYVFNCNSGGISHKHAANRVFARKVI